MAMVEEIFGSLFRGHFGVGLETLTMLPQSGGSRRYYQLTGGGFVCAGMEGGNVVENDAFVYLARHFRSKGINVPEVYAVSDDGKFCIQQWLGSKTLFSAVSEGRARAQAGVGEIYSSREEDLLCRAIAELPKIQFEGADGLDFGRCFPVPAMDAMSIMFDLNYFKYCYLLPSGAEYDEVRLQNEFEKLSADLLSEDFSTFMYRDFQTRNIMVVDGEPYFIDFQGGRRGPIYYDVASFVFQASSCFPSALREKMIGAYLAALERYQKVGKEEFISRLRLFLLFRTMQVLGAYGFRGLYQRKAHFIESIPFALANLRDLLAEPFVEYPYLSALLSSLASKNENGNVARGDGKITENDEGRLVVKITSFSYKAGIPEDESGNGGGYVFDCRGMNNPGRYERYRHSTGRDADVIEFIETDGGVFAFLEGVYAMVDPHVANFLERGFTSLCVNFGCTGGHHRSVYCAEALAKHIAEKFPAAIVRLRHTRLGIEEIKGGNMILE